MRSFSERPTPAQADIGLAVLRVVAGIVFAAHGGQKLFGYGLEGVIGGFAGMGIPFASIAAPAITALELVGGVALAIGLFTRPLALLFVGDMLGAILFVHAKGGFFVPTGIEFVTTLAAISIALALAGPRRYSVDAMLASRRK
jgi:putative oxidoreductase